MTVALFIVAMIMTLTYGLLKQLLDSDERYGRRALQLRDQLVIQRTLVGDLARALPGKEAALKLDRDGFGLRLSGDVLPSYSLGSAVEVRYSWPQEAGEFQWRRGFIGAFDGEPLEGWQFAIADGLEQVRYRLRVGRDWIQPEAYVEGTVRAVEWVFSWSEIGEWRVVAPLGDEAW